MKGIILAGGAGSRLYPLTRVSSKQLQPVYDKPMVYYPLTTLIESSIREICLISTPHDLPRFKALLGTGRQLGLEIEYREQQKPAGLAHAFIVAEDFIGKDSSALILGDNLFFGGDTTIQKTISEFREGATAFACQVDNPERYGIVEFNSTGRPVSIEEKPAIPKSRYAVPGLYLFDHCAPMTVRHQNPSARGELEITDTLSAYLQKEWLSVKKLPRGFAWLDAGTNSSLHDASAYVQTVELRTGIKLGCPEEAAFRAGLINLDQLKGLIQAMPACEYRTYLEHSLNG